MPLSGLGEAGDVLVASAFAGTVTEDGLATWCADNREAAFELQVKALAVGGHWGQAAAAFIAAATQDPERWVAAAADEPKGWGLRTNAIAWLRFVSDADRAHAAALVSKQLLTRDIDSVRLAASAFGFLGDIEGVDEIVQREHVGASGSGTEKLAEYVCMAYIDAYVHRPSVIDETTLDKAAATAKAAQIEHVDPFGLTSHTRLRALNGNRAGPILARFSEPSSLRHEVLIRVEHAPDPTLVPQLQGLEGADAFAALAFIDSPDVWRILESVGTAAPPERSTPFVIACGVQCRGESVLLDALARGSENADWEVAWSLGRHAEKGSEHALTALVDLVRTSEPLTAATAILGLAKAGTRVTPDPSMIDSARSSAVAAVLGIAAGFSGDANGFVGGLAPGIRRSEPVWMLESPLAGDARDVLAHRLGSSGQLLAAFEAVGAAS